MTHATLNTGGRGSVPVLAAVCLAAVIMPLSFSGAAMATHAIGNDLGGSPSALNWITNAFMLTFGSFLMSAGALADAFGRKRLFMIGVASFALVSLAIGLAPTLIVLDILRAAQGIAAAATLSGGTAALAQEFDSQARARAFGLLGTTFGVGLAFGPILSALLIEALGWRSIFLSGAIIGALALVLAGPRMRESRDPGAQGFDWLGAVTFTGMLSLFTFGLIEAPASGWTSPLVMSLFMGTIAMLIAFAVVESRVARPLLDFSLFRYPRFVGVQLLPIATCYCYVVLLVLLPLRFIGIEGYSELRAGLLMMALSAPMLLIPLVAAALTRWVSAGVISGVGLLIASAGLVCLGRIDVGAGGAALLIPLLLIGIGTAMP